MNFGATVVTVLSKTAGVFSDLIMPAQMELRNQGLILMTVHRKWWNEYFIPGVNMNVFRSKSLSGGDDFGT
jgi:hypothetical protein